MTGRFAMVVEDMFHITGRGTVFTGVVRSGRVRVGDRVAIRSPTAQLVDRVAGVERDRELLDEASPGEAVGLLFLNFAPHRLADGLERTEVGDLDGPEPSHRVRPPVASVAGEVAMEDPRALQGEPGHVGAACRLSDESLLLDLPAGVRVSWAPTPMRVGTPRSHSCRGGPSDPASGSP
jgi:hypothetical protein